MAEEIKKEEEVIKEKKEIENVSSELSNSYSNGESFLLAQRVAKALSTSTIIPVAYQNNMPNCLIALEMSQRLKLSPFIVMQNMYIVYGNPSWSSTFLIAQINSSKNFKGSLNFQLEGEVNTDSRTCTAWIKDKDGSALIGTPVSILMAKSEGWFGKKGSKWQTMPEQMLRYRAAAFFARLYCPEVTMGLQTSDEIVDVEFEPVESDKINDDLGIKVPEQENLL